MVIVWRNDLKVRTGKKMAMASHAANSFLTKAIFRRKVDHYSSEFVNNEYGEHTMNEIEHWLENSFRKIVCYVNSEEELDTIHQKALDKGLISHMIIDNGATEFNGVLTKTAIAVGPAWDDKFIGITDHLPLL
jgi:PTH2 family peptidyl-tRNA hydrolase